MPFRDRHQAPRHELQSLKEPAELVKTHVQWILAKLGLRDRIQAVIFVYEAGVILIGSHEQ